MESNLEEVNDNSGTDRDVFISSGTSGGLVLSMMSMINPGDEVIFSRPVLRDVSGAGENVWWCAVTRRLLSRFQARPEQDRSRDHAAHQNDLAQQSRQPDRRHGRKRN